VSYSWVFQDGSSQEMAAPVKRLNLVLQIQGEGEIPFQDAKRELGRLLL
jgi:hypothetical protein